MSDASERDAWKLRALMAEEALIKAEVQIGIDNQIIAERQRILEACPCPVHGPCVPYVLHVLSHLKQ